MQTLQLTKITKSQLPLLATALVTFHQQYERANRIRRLWVHPEEYRHTIPLTSYYQSLKVNSKNRGIVKFAASVFFKQETRGCYKTKEASKWLPRDIPYVSEQMKKLLPDLFEKNKQHIQAVETAIYESGKTVVVNTTFAFSSDSEARTFTSLVRAIQLDEEVARPLTRMSKNTGGYTLQQSLNTILKKWADGSWEINYQKALDMLSYGFGVIREDIDAFIKSDEKYAPLFEKALLD